MDLTSDPTAREDELDLLACCMSGFNPSDIDTITADDFYEPKHAQVWQAMCAVAESGGTPDPPSVRLALGPHGERFAPWLIDVFGRPVAPLNAPPLAERVRKASRLRDLTAMARGLMQDATADGADPDALTERYRMRLDRPTGVARPTERIGDIMPRVYDEIERGRPSGLSTPWPDLDRHIHGLAPDRLHIVAARPGVGKSLLGQNLAMHFAQHHRLPVLFASLEMASDELGMRIMAQAARVDLSSMLAAKVSAEDWDRIDQAMPMLGAAPIHLSTDASQSVENIRAAARDLQRRDGLGLVVVDYLQLVRPRDHRLPREQQVSEISRSLKLLAKELHVPVVAMSQIRRLNDGERSKRPTLSDLRESGAIEQDADVVLILHIPDDQEPYAGELLVAKARSGTRGAIDLHMKTRWATIASAQRSA